MGVRVLIPLSRDPYTLHAAASSAYRVFEEYPVASFLLAPSRPVAQDLVESMHGIAGKLVGRGNVVRVAPVGVTPERARESRPWRGLIPELRDLIKSKCAGYDGMVVVVSPAGRWYSAALGVAGSTAKECPVDVVHVHFYFGPWSGLAYPYTPRRLHPLIVMHGGLPERGLEGGENAAQTRYAPSLSWQGGGCGPSPPWAAGGLTPLRCAVAEAARVLNDVEGARVRLEHGKAMLGPCGRLEVAIDGGSLGAFELCDERDVARLAGRLARAIHDLLGGVDERLARQLAAWAGLHPLEARLEGDERGVSLVRRRPGRPLLADTNLVYYGVHAYAWAGLRVALPECAVIEVERAWAEAAPRRRLSSPRDVAAAAAYLALQDLKASGAPVLPSMPVACDVAIPRMERLLTLDYLLATADERAHRYWTSMVPKPGEAVKVSFSPERAWEPMDAGDPEAIPYIYYSVVQGLLLLGLALRQGADAGGRGGRERLRLTLKLNGRSVDKTRGLEKAVEILERALGLQGPG